MGACINDTKSLLLIAMVWSEDISSIALGVPLAVRGSYTPPCCITCGDVKFDGATEKTIAYPCSGGLLRGNGFTAP